MGLVFIFYVLNIIFYFDYVIEGEVLINVEYMKI